MTSVTGNTLPLHEGATVQAWLKALRSEHEALKTQHGDNVLDSMDGRTIFRSVMARRARGIRVSLLRDVCRSVGINRVGNTAVEATNALANWYISVARFSALEAAVMVLQDMSGVVDRQVNDSWTALDLTFVDGKRVRVTLQEV